MSDFKKYYYLKIKDDFYESDEIKLLQSMPEGYLFSDILMKLYLKSLQSNGKLMFKDRIPYSPDMIATITNHQVSVVEKALHIFKELGLIDILDNGAIFMLDIENFIGQSSNEAERKKAYRQRIKEEKTKLLIEDVKDVKTKEKDICPDIVQESEDSAPPEIRDRDRDRYKDKDIDKPKPKAKVQKHKYGEYKHVMLKETEHTKLINELGDIATNNCITYLDEYIEMKGYKAKNHYLCIKKWVIDAVRKQQGGYNNVTSNSNGVRTTQSDFGKNKNFSGISAKGAPISDEQRRKADKLLI